MSDKLIEHISRFVSLTQDDSSNIITYFKHKKIKKKQHLLEEGQICKSNYFVEKGCLRMYFINDKGIELTTQFAIENWWIADYMSFGSLTPSGFYIQAVENSDILSIDYQTQEKLLTDFPQLEKYFRVIFQRAYASSQLRIKYLYDFSKEEMYDHFSSSYPEFIQRVPQYMIASFLGFTPEYLSELRKKKLS
jgi:CRP-like cAMP-binding protein